MKRRTTIRDLLRVTLSGQSELLGDQQSWQLLYLDFHHALTFLLQSSSLVGVAVRPTSLRGLQEQMQEEGRNRRLSRGGALNEHLHHKEQFIDSLQSRKQHIKSSSASLCWFYYQSVVLVDNEIESQINKILYDACMPQAAKKFDYSV